jgi:hypothetical protein
MKAKHFIIGGLILGAVVMLAKTAKAGLNLSVSTGAQIVSLSLSKITLALEPVIQNPTGGGITIKFPIVEIFYKKKRIAYTEPHNVNIYIAPRSSVNLRSYLKSVWEKDFTIDISIISVGMLGAELVKLATGLINQIELTTRSTTIAYAPHFPIVGFPYSEESLTLIKRPSFL